MDGLRGDDSIAQRCCREGISQGIHYKWLKGYMEACNRLAENDYDPVTETKTLPLDDSWPMSDPWRWSMQQRKKCF